MLFRFTLLSVLLFLLPACVGYAQASWSPEAREAALAIAREAVEAAVLAREPTRAIKPLPAPLRRRAGAFVTLSLDGRTRGCMGSLHPSEPDLAAQIAAAATAAAIADPYHRPIRRHELPHLTYHIAIVQGSPWRARSTAELRPATLALCVQSGRRGGVMLPGEARTARWQLLMARKKAGLQPGEPAEMLLFKTITISSR
jgi:MEMO1 family protein